MTLGPPRRRLVCITGMHRSGTSVAARALELLGVSLGHADSLQPAGRDNPAGYWENRYIKELDDEVLAVLGGAWDAPPVLDPGWEDRPELAPFHERARGLLQTQFDPAHDLVACKDPRLSLLLPFWRSQAAIEATVVVVRHPGEVAASLGARNGMAPADASMLWLRYVLGAMTNDPAHLLVRHDDLTGAIPRVLADMSRHLGLPPPSAAVERAVAEHLDPALQHHVASAADHTPADPVGELALAVWNGGDVDPRALGDAVRDAIVRGWMRTPSDADALMAARAKAVAFEEEIRRRNRRDREARAAES